MYKSLFLFVTVVFCYISHAQVQTVTSRIVNSYDDAEERGANATSNPGEIDLTSSDLELVAEPTNGDQWIGMRFTNVTVPSGVYIYKAYIQFTVDELDSLPGSVILHGEAADSSTTFDTTSFGISNRPRTNDSIVWSNIPVWKITGAAGVDQRSADISSIIQEIIDRNGWKSGNSLTIIAHGSGKRVAESQDGDPTSAPLLVVQYFDIPVADFKADTTWVPAVGTVKFTDLSTNNPTSWNWTFAGGTPNVSTDSMPSIAYVNPGVFDVTLVASNPAGSSAPLTKTGYIAVGNIGLRESIAAHRIDVYPNPTKGKVNIRSSLQQEHEVSLTLYDLTGKKLLDMTIHDSESDEWTFDLSDHHSEAQLFILDIEIDGTLQREFIQFTK